MEQENQWLEKLNSVIQDIHQVIHPQVDQNDYNLFDELKDEDFQSIQKYFGKWLYDDKWSYIEINWIRYYHSFSFNPDKFENKRDNWIARMYVMDPSWKSYTFLFVIHWKISWTWVIFNIDWTKEQYKRQSS